jgi:acetyltransferase-like isoleucine patch superfamily enzyme
MLAMAEGLLTRLRTGLAAHGGESPAAAAERIARSVVALGLSHIALRACDRVGPRARVLGWTRIDNRGQLFIGRDFSVLCTFCGVELATAPGGVLTIGDQVTINFGTLITAAREVRIGDRVSIGPYCVVCDTDVPHPLDGGPEDRGRPIVVEEGAWLAARVTLLPGAHVGAGAVVSAGSVVSGHIPAGSVAAGIPARPLRVAAGNRPRVAANGSPALRALIVSDFVTDELAFRLREEDPPFVEATTESLGEAGAPARAESVERDVDLALVWTTAEGVLPALAELVAGGEASRARLLSEVDAHAQLVARRFARCPCVIVPTWGLAPELRNGRVAGALAAANARLAEQIAALLPAARVLDASRWCARPGAFSAVMRYAANVPFSPQVFADAACDIKDTLRGARGEARSVLVVEAPPGPQDAPAREARADLDRALEALRRRGVAVHLVDAGQGLAAVEALSVPPSRRVLATLDAAARARARELLPELLVPELAADPLSLPSAVRALRAFGDA